MRVQLIFRNEAAGLTKDGAEGADIQTGVRRNSEHLSLVRSCALQFQWLPCWATTRKPNSLRMATTSCPDSLRSLGIGGIDFEGDHAGWAFPQPEGRRRFALEM